ncbi:MAG: hypothetical protein IPO58_12455 [Betaproteobacteria bacterium]|nr:hypothetical protein [Betaproteobacteria bacterium]
MILQRTVERAQMEKLLASGKTDLLQFVSARTRRPYQASLVRQTDGEIGFEFEKRAPQGGRRQTAAKKTCGRQVAACHFDDVSCMPRRREGSHDAQSRGHPAQPLHGGLCARC